MKSHTTYRFLRRVGLEYLVELVGLVAVGCNDGLVIREPEATFGALVLTTPSEHANVTTQLLQLCDGTQIFFVKNQKVVIRCWLSKFIILFFEISSNIST